MERYGLQGFEKRKPHELSGGMRQRAALLRTLLTEREVLLLDEPFGALDALTRLQLQLGLTDVWQTFHKTILLVTHDVEEAIFLSDQILVLSPRPGRVRRQMTVPLPRPRTVDMLASPEVMGMKKELLELLLQEEGTAMKATGETPSGVRDQRVRRSPVVQLWRWGILLALLVLWEAGARLGWIDGFYFSSPTQIFQTAVVKWQQGNLWADIVYTGASTLLGFVLGTVVGSAVGLLFWFSRRVALVSEPYLIVLNALPKLALAPVLVILFGIGFPSKVVLAFLMTVVTAAHFRLWPRAQRGPCPGNADVLPGCGTVAGLLPCGSALCHAVDHLRPAGKHRAEHGGSHCGRIHCIRSGPGAYDRLCRHHL